MMSIRRCSSSFGTVSLSQELGVPAQATQSGPASKLSMVHSSSALVEFSGARFRGLAGGGDRSLYRNQDCHRIRIDILTRRSFRVDGMVVSSSSERDYLSRIQDRCANTLEPPAMLWLGCLSFRHTVTPAPSFSFASLPFATRLLSAMNNGVDSKLKPQSKESWNMSLLMKSSKYSSNHFSASVSTLCDPRRPS